jgi:hypothetical protein
VTFSADLVDRPVAVEVLHRTEFAERHGRQRAAMMPQPDRPQAEGLDDALVAAAFDIFADTEGIVPQIEHAADDVLDDRLRAEADGDADDAGAGDQRPDLHAEAGEHHQNRDHGDDDRQDIAEDRQQRLQPCAPCLLLVVAGHPAANPPAPLI